MLARHALRGSNKEFWRYHGKTMDDLAIRFQPQKMMRPLLLESVDALVHFRRTTRAILASLHMKSLQGN
jgi:hypothetical protein